MRKFPKSFLLLNKMQTTFIPISVPNLKFMKLIYLVFSEKKGDTNGWNTFISPSLSALWNQESCKSEERKSPWAQRMLSYCLKNESVEKIMEKACFKLLLLSHFHWGERKMELFINHVPMKAVLRFLRQHFCIEKREASTTAHRAISLCS